MTDSGPDSSFRLDVPEWNDPIKYRVMLRRPQKDDVGEYEAWANTTVVKDVRRAAEFLHATGDSICEICQEPIDISLRHPHPGSAEIDHIVPRAKGGPNTWGNVRVAHRLCNGRRNVERTPLTVEDAKQSLLLEVYEFDHPEELPERLSAIMDEVTSIIAAARAARTEGPFWSLSDADERRLSYLIRRGTRIKARIESATPLKRR